MEAPVSRPLRLLALEVWFVDKISVPPVKNLGRVGGTGNNSFSEVAGLKEVWGGKQGWLQGKRPASEGGGRLSS